MYLTCETKETYKIRMISKSNIDTPTPFPSVHLFMLVNGPSLRDEYENMQKCAPKITKECSFWNRVCLC